MVKTIFIRYLTLVGGFTLFFSTSLFSQTYLEKYIEEGLANNIVMKQKNIGLEKSLLALKEARSWYYPSATFTGDYTWAEGGRTIPFPVGDLLNPIYSTLNQLTGSQNFPMVENLEIQLMPKDFYDARIRVVYPVISPERHYNYRIKKDEILMAEYEVETYKQELIRDIETAYYNYCLAVDAKKILEGALELVNKNLTINESLVRNGKGLHANVLRAESEAEQIRSRLREAENMRLNARSWFNFLLNKQLTDTVVYEFIRIPGDLNAAISGEPVIAGRSELKKLSTALTISQSVLDMNKRYAVPRVYTFMDIGSQAFNWDFNSKTRFLFAGVQVNMPVFSGMRNQARISTSRLEISELELMRENVSRQFSVAAGVSRNNLNTAMANHTSSLKQYESARAYFRLIETGYSEGVNSLIEFMDARNQLTTSEIQVKLNWYKVLSAYADLKRQTAGS